MFSGNCRSVSNRTVTIKKQKSANLQIRGSNNCPLWLRVTELMTFFKYKMTKFAKSYQICTVGTIRFYDIVKNGKDEQMKDESMWVIDPGYFQCNIGRFSVYVLRTVQLHFCVSYSSDCLRAEHIRALLRRDYSNFLCSSICVCTVLGINLALWYLQSAPITCAVVFRKPFGRQRSLLSSKRNQF